MTFLLCRVVEIYMGVSSYLKHSPACIYMISIVVQRWVGRMTTDMLRACEIVLAAMGWMRQRLLWALGG